MDFVTHERADGAVVVIEVPARLDATVAEPFRTHMNQLVDQGKFQLVMDFEKTTFMDSSGLGAIVSRIAVTRSNQGDVRLARLSSFIRQLLETTNLDKILTCFEDVDSAVQSFGS